MFLKRFLNIKNSCLFLFQIGKSKPKDSILVVGGVERIKKRGFLHTVWDKSNLDLVEMILNNVLPQSIIIISKNINDSDLLNGSNTEVLWKHDYKIIMVKSISKNPHTKTIGKVL